MGQLRKVTLTDGTIQVVDDEELEEYQDAGLVAEATKPSSPEVLTLTDVYPDME